LIRLGTAATEEEVKDTANAQRLIVGASMAVFREAFTSERFDGVLGHSVGEYAAAAIASVITDEEAMQLVAIRADAMAEASARESTSMAAVLGGDQDLVLQRINELGLYAANYNGSGQIVSAGKKQGILDLVSSPPAKSRVIELKVAGAFHTSYMASAVEKVREAAEQLTPNDPKVRLWSNFDGAEIASGRDFLTSLVDQIARPVRWDLCMRNLDVPEATVVELPPAGALAGLIKRGAPAATAIALKEPFDLEKLNR
jgi:[acyl-carrier-protein] S-malonyltransferase